MLFNSYVFIFLFLPFTAIVFYALKRVPGNLSLFWLISASLFFYGWWNPIYLFLLLPSVLLNYLLGNAVSRFQNTVKGRLLLYLGVAANLSVLGYFKYANFLLESANHIADTQFRVSEIVLPLAISFFTFQQITYLVDSFRGLTAKHGITHYFIFVTFFPQLIAGPIVHHKEMLVQFCKTATSKFDNRDLAIGITIFFIGLFKKVIIADSIALYSTPIFIAAENGEPLSFFVAWAGALGFSFQLYFDFSGYSDMAIGCAKIFGINLPINFFSPYKANNIIDFWRRWHITLSRFLRDYLYIPLGGNRKGKVQRYINLLITMLLGGLWHGASWTFVIWGGVHGLYLVINHGWRKLIPEMKLHSFPARLGYASICRLVTFISVIVAWVIFRSETYNGAIAIYTGMLGLNGFVLPPVNIDSLGIFRGLPDFMMALGVQFQPIALLDRGMVIQLAILLCVVWFTPNSQQLLGDFFPNTESNGTMVHSSKASIYWKPSAFHALIMAVIAFYTIISMNNVSEFLYYQF